MLLFSDLFMALGQGGGLPIRSPRHRKDFGRGHVLCDFSYRYHIWLLGEGERLVVTVSGSLDSFWLGQRVLISGIPRRCTLRHGVGGWGSILDRIMQTVSPNRLCWLCYLWAAAVITHIWLSVPECA